MKRILAIVFLSICLFPLIGCSNSDEDYITKIRDVADKMLDNAANAEDILHQYSKIWSYSIENRSPIPVENIANEMNISTEDVREYFTINSAGNVPNDFSLNVHSMVSYYENIGDLGKLKESSDEIKNKINELNNPPNEYEKLYDEVLDMYTYTEEFIELALNPSGNLQSFNEKVNQLSNEIINTYKRIEVILPNEEK